MSPRARRSCYGGRPRAGQRWQWRVAALAVSVTLLGGVFVAAGTLGTGPVGKTLAAHGDGEDFEPPQVTNVSREGTTSIELRMTDNHDVDESTIDAGDFDVEPGSISNLETSQDGSDAVIELNLSGVGNEAVTVSSADGANINDTNGNEFDPTNQFSEVVPAPEVNFRLFNATRINASVVELYLINDAGLDEETVETNDFTTNRSSIEEISFEPDGSNATVTLTLDRGTDFGPLRVGISEDAQFTDLNGTVIDGPFRSVRVEGVSPPELHSVSKLSTTEIELYFVDDKDVAEGSFQAHDFQVAKPRRLDVPVSQVVSGGNFDGDSLFDLRLEEVRATEDGSNATVVIELVRPVDVDELLVRVRDDAVVTDTQGHEMDPTDEETKSWEIIDGMDGVPPEVERFTVNGTSSDAVELSIAASERLGGVNVSVEGPVSDRLDRSAFTFNNSSNVYRATYTPDAEGNVAFRLVDVTDRVGNTRKVDIVRTSGVDRSGPKPVIAIDFAASENLTLVFDGRHTTDLTGVSSYTWSFDDGTNTTGRRVTKTFDPGAHTVSLTATDPKGQSGTTSVDLDLSPGAGDVDTATVDGLGGLRRVADPTVRVVRPGDGPAETALLEIRKPSPGVPVSASEGPGEGLARTGDLVLEDIEVVPRRYREFTLGISASGPESDFVAAAARETETRPIGGFTVTHDVPDAEFRSVTLLASVDTDRLAGMDADPEDLTVLRQTDDGWQSLQTTPVRGTEGRTRVRAESPGLSRFVVVVEGQQPTPTGGETPTPSTPTANGSNGTRTTATPTPTPTPEGQAVVVTNATLSQQSVDPGTTVLVNATVENRGDGTTSYVAGLSVNGTVVATQSVTLPAGETGSVSFRYVANETGTHPVAVNGTRAGELTVGGGGLLASALGVFDPIFGLLGSVFGFLPLGLLRPLAIFVGVPLLVIYLILKGLAIYLGY